jgi:adenosylcobyric acid synthase
MVLGTTSGAGKSWLTTALCRYYQRQGLRVAPFKAQNMSNNARVVASENGLGEIGSAQYFQALAARAVPDVRMNPLLLKPERDTHSQVVLMGQVSEALSNMAWRERSEPVWPQIAQALDALRAEHDVVVIEGAGSPAEINLSSSDIVNMRVALHCDAACLLVTDIDRGGAFAHLYGTWALLPGHERSLIKGFVLNKFRGDASLLAPAPQMLQDLTGIPTMATLPMWWQHGLPEEDGIFDMACALGTGLTSPSAEGAHAAGGGPAPLAQPSPILQVCIVAYPRISNLDEFQPIKNVPGVRLQWVRNPSELHALKPTDWIILPGSKNTSGDLAWLRSQGLDAAVARHAGRGGAVLGICGGLQMLGEALIDPQGVDGNAPGLGLLPLVTVFAQNKTVRHTHSQFAPNLAAGNPWSALAGVQVSGYEIHHGQTHRHAGMQAAGDVAREILPQGLGWQSPVGNVLGLYLHGLFEDPSALQALFGARLGPSVPTLDSVFDGLADFIAQHFAPGALQSLLN